MDNCNVFTASALYFRRFAVLRLEFYVTTRSDDLNVMILRLPFYLADYVAFCIGVGNGNGLNDDADRVG